jgi:DNA ligase-1
MHAHELFNKYADFDGELIVGNPTDGNEVYNRTQSYVMSADERPKLDLRYYVFDNADLNWKDTWFQQRLKSIELQINSIGDTKLYFVEHELVENLEQLLIYEEKQLRLGYEGVMGRNPWGRYKHGRGTFKEGLIYKIKRFTDAEAVITGFEEQLDNHNELQVSELGYAKRSKSQDGLVPAGTLGKFIVNWNGHRLPVGCGSFKHDERQWIWNNREKVIGRFLKFRYFAHGIKDLPRHPRAVGFRHPMDM